MLSSTAKDIFVGLWRLGTTEQYQTYLQRWQEYCEEHSLDSFEPGECNRVSGLIIQYILGLGYSAINTVHSALSTILVMENGVKFGEHPLVVRYMKGIFQLRPA